MAPQISRHGALVLVRCIHPSWGVKRDILALIGEYPGGVEAPYRWVAEELGVDAGWVWKCMKVMSAGRVILTDPGVGRRGTIVRLNPFIGQYRGVPLKFPVDDVTRRVREADRLDDENIAHPHVSVARALARSDGVIERGTTDLSAAQNAALRVPQEPVVPRSGAAQNAARNAARNAAQGTRSAAFLDPITTDTPASSSSPTAGAPPPGGGRPSATSGAAEGQSPALARACGIVRQAAAPTPDGRRYMAPSQRARVAALLDRHPFEDLVAALPYRDHDLMVPGLLDWLESALDLGEDLAGLDLWAAEPAPTAPAREAPPAPGDELDYDEPAASCGLAATEGYDVAAIARFRDEARRVLAAKAGPLLLPPDAIQSVLHLGQNGHRSDEGATS